MKDITLYKMVGTENRKLDKLIVLYHIKMEEIKPNNILLTLFTLQKIKGAIIKWGKI